MAQVIDPNSQQTYEIPDNEVDQATAKGYQQVTPTPTATPQPVKPTVDITPLQEQEQHPAVATQLAEQTQETPAQQQLSDMDLTPDKQARVFDPQTGQEYHIPPEQVNDAKEKGYVVPSDVKLEVASERKFQSEVDQLLSEFQQEQWKASKSPLGQTGDIIDTAIGSVVQGPADAIAAKVRDVFGHTTTQDLELDKALKEARSEFVDEHPMAYWAAKLPFELGAAIGLGGAGEAVTGALKLSGLAKIAVEGGIYNAPEALEKAVQGNWGQVAEALAIGGVTNVALHGLVSGVQSAGGAISKAINPLFGATGEEEQKLAQNVVSRALGISPGKVEDLRENIAPLVDAAGIEEKDSVETMVKKVQDLQESGPAIGRAIKSLDGLDGSIKSSIVTKTMDNVITKLQQLVPEAFVEGEKLSPSAQQAFKALQPIMDEAKATADKGTFQAQQDFKKFVGDQTNFTDNKFINQIRRQAYGIIRNETQAGEEQAANQLGNPATITALKQQRGAYALSQIFGDYADKMGAKAGLDTPLKHILGSFHAGRYSMLGLMTHAFFPHPAVIPAVIGAGMLKEGATKYLQSKVLSQAIGVLKNSTTPATDVTLQAVQGLKDYVTKNVSEMLSDLAKPAVKRAAIQGMTSFLPNNGVGLNKTQQLQQLQKNYNSATSNLDQTSQHFAQMTQPLVREGLHPAAQAVLLHQMSIAKVIQAMLPPDNSTTNDHNPFLPKVSGTNGVSASTLDRINRVMAIASDPNHLLSMIKDNSITASDVAIAAATNPFTLDAMRKEVIMQTMSEKPDLTYQQSLSMGILMGQKIDVASQQIGTLQDTYTPIAPINIPGQTGGKGGRHKMGADTQKSLANNSLTVSQQAQELEAQNQ
jgi:hypothetical protein